LRRRLLLIAAYIYWQKSSTGAGNLKTTNGSSTAFSVYSGITSNSINKIGHPYGTTHPDHIAILLSNSIIPPTNVITLSPHQPIIPSSYFTPSHTISHYQNSITAKPQSNSNKINSESRFPFSLHLPQSGQRHLLWDRSVFSINFIVFHPSKTSTRKRLEQLKEEKP
jgi:hypothetical protein